MNSFGVLEKKNKFYSHTVSETLLDLLNKSFEIPETFQGGLVMVDEQYIARPDLVAIDVYGDDSYTDLICKINGISNPFELNVGMTLLLPTSSDLEEFILIPSQKWAESETQQKNIATPVPKQANQPRQPNEAVIGDRRFNIDETSQIIVY